MNTLDGDDVPLVWEEKQKEIYFNLFHLMSIKIILNYWLRMFYMNY